MLDSVLLIICINIFFYHKVLNFGYLIDDLDSFRRANGCDTKTIANKELEALKNNKTTRDFRILKLSQIGIEELAKKGAFWRDKWSQLVGQYYFNPKQEHLMGIIVHTLNCVLIYFAFGATRTSLLASILFSLNPVTTQGSVWLSGRTYALSTFMILLGLTVPILFPSLYIISYFSVNTIFAPILFIERNPHFYVLFLPVCIYLLRRKFTITAKLRYESSSEIMRRFEWRKLILVSKTFAYYTKLCLLPHKIGMCHSYLHTYGLSKEESEPWYKLDKYFWAGIGLAILLLTGLVMRWNMYGLIYFSIFIAQWCNLIVINHPITERYLYFPAVFMMWTLANVCMFYPPLAFIALTYYATRLWHVLPSYINLMEYWKSNVENFPEIAMAYNQTGLAFMEYGNAGTGFDYWIKGIQTRPKDFRINYNIANFLTGIGQGVRAVPFLKKAEEALDIRNNYDLWKGNIDKLKEVCKTQGAVFSNNGDGKK